MTALLSSAVGSSIDVLDATAGVVARPYQALQQARSSKASTASYEETSYPAQASSQPNGPADLTTTQIGVVDAEEAAITSSANDEGSKHKLSKAIAANVGETGPVADPSLCPPDGDSTASVSKSNKIIKTSAAMTDAGARGLGRAVATSVRAASVNIPLAITEELRAVPRLYGEEPRDVGIVTGIRSGITIAGKALTFGVFEAVTDIVTLPARDMSKYGHVGLGSGAGKGLLHLAIKPPAAALGLIAYPAQGTTKSVRSAYRSTVRKKVRAANEFVGQWLLKTGKNFDVDSEAIIATFEGFTKQDKKRQNFSCLAQC